MRAIQSQTTRCAGRMALVRPCRYEMTEVHDGEPVMLHQGYGISVNVSEHGMLLLLPQTAHVRQVFEVEALAAEGGSESAMRVVEVRWTKEVPTDAEGILYLAGVKFLPVRSPLLRNGFVQ